jgi:hypothetical protein
MRFFEVFFPPSTLTPEVRRFQQQVLLFGIGGLALCVVGAFFRPEQFFRAYLLAYVFWIGLVLGCLGIVMMYHLSGGAWGVVIRRMLESATRTLPVMVVLFIPLLFGLHDLYAWARPDVVANDELLQHKRLYLNVPFFVLRAVLYFVAWGGVAYLLNRWSREQDQRATDPRPTRRLRLLSGPGLVLYGLGITFAAIDWLMSLEPHWYSTIFGVTLMVGQGLNAFAFAIIVIALLADREPLSRVLAPVHFQDLGSLLLAFVMLWTYMAFSQWLVIWSGNLPEENVWYVHRLQGGWQWFGVVLIVFHFVLPFFLLLSRDLKRNAHALAVVAAAIMVMRFVDLFWLIIPAFYPDGFHIHWMYIVAPLSLGALWLAMFIRQLGERPLLPLHDPNLRGAIAHGRH